MSIDEKLDAVLVELRKTNALLVAMVAAHDQGGVSRDAQIVTHLRFSYDRGRVEQLLNEQVKTSIGQLVDALEAQRS